MLGEVIFSIRLRICNSKTRKLQHQEHTKTKRGIGRDGEERGGKERRGKGKGKGAGFKS